MLTVTCQYCQKDFTTEDQSQLFCDKECKKASGRDCLYTLSKCLVCDQEFKHLGGRITCSRECRSKYILSLFGSGLSVPYPHSAVVSQIMSSIFASNSKLVKKGWGFEAHIINNDKYCLKYLVFLEGKKFSHHYHCIKQEAWHCLVGKFNLLIECQDQRKEMEFNQGDKIELKSGVVHQLMALENSIIVEVSTRDFPEDSIRLEKGD